ncbi:DHHC palmitoyltransferase-domain-containing protein [Crepidotus variabilis]|uniref:Palmitoyltransferase n=1 Tax=Crepidotus variabilis TaxID=179855 RepID=A0A9P6E9U7_9AGAR|nr:DHHC palmitoyltransferase-domain-containing protein [Crepidotus variabilis]
MAGVMHTGPLWLFRAIFTSYNFAWPLSKEIVPGAKIQDVNGLLSVFCLLYILVLWAYAKVVLTPPGHARDHTRKTPEPPLPLIFNLNDHGPRSSLGSSTLKHGSITTTKNISTSLRASASSLGDISLTRLSYAEDSSEASFPQHFDNTPFDQHPKDSERTLRYERLVAFRQPSRTPILNATNRYCWIDGLMKPSRAHHCHTCTTCILKFSHHCDWIGQCIGARNHKYFVNFCLLTALVTFYTFITLLTCTLAPMPASTTLNESSHKLNPHIIIGTFFSTFFCPFTGHQFTKHVWHILHGQTLVESLYISRILAKEEEALNTVFSFWEFNDNWRIRQQWDQQWGSLHTEGNIWWRGSKWTEWIDVMGVNKLGWLLPFGVSQSDGLEYPMNPRFNGEGVLQKRVKWPKELR